MSLHRFPIALLVALLMLFAVAACGDDTEPEDGGEAPVIVDDPRAFEANQDEDRSEAPGADAPDDGRRGAVTLRSNQIATRFLKDGTVTAGKVAYKATTVSVAMGAGSGASASDPDLAGGVLLGCHPSSNQDQHVDNIALNSSTGAITVTLAANATAANQFRCITLKANSKGTQ